MLPSDKFDLLTQTPEEMIREMFPDGDPGSPIPVPYQFINRYINNEKGVHAFVIDADGNMDIDTLYPIPFVVTMNTHGTIFFDFFIDRKVVEVTSNLEKFIEDYFHSLKPNQRLAIKRYASVCIMKQLPVPDGTKETK